MPHGSWSCDASPSVVARLSLTLLPRGPLPSGENGDASVRMDALIRAGVGVWRSEVAVAFQARWKVSLFATYSWTNLRKMRF